MIYEKHLLLQSHDPRLECLGLRVVLRNDAVAFPDRWFELAYRYVPFADRRLALARKHPRRDRFPLQTRLSLHSTGVHYAIVAGLYAQFDEIVGVA